MSRIVVVGGGQAGMQVAESLRRARFEGEIVLIAEEPWLPYQRPPLSTKFLFGEITAEEIARQRRADREDARVVRGRRLPAPRTTRSA